MKNPIPSLLVTAAILSLAPTTHAELPMLTEKPWLGYFLGYKDRKFQFGITSKDGQAIFEPLKSNGTPVNIHSPIKIQFKVLETMPDGKVVSRQIKASTLASAHPASDDPEKPVTVTGKVTGDIGFEYTITPERGAISISGKITDKGTVTNPVAFAVSMGFTPYKWQSEKPDDDKAFEKKMKGDEMRLQLTSGKRAKIEFIDNINPATTHPEGFLAAEIRTEGYGGVNFELASTPKSKITFEDKGENPLWKTISLQWRVDEGADPATEKLTFGAK